MTRIYDSAREFGDALDRVVKKFELEADTVIRKACIDVTNNIIDDTPHDTGRARAGWHFTTVPSLMMPPAGQMRYDKPEVADPGQSGSAQYFIQNNVEYIVPLEDGHSLQAPRGMVAINLAAYADHLNRHTRDAETIKPG